MVQLGLQSIALQQIDPSYRWSLHQDLSEVLDPNFVDSIRKFGLLHPPIIRKSSDSYELICGARRVEAVKRIAEQQDIHCLVLDQSISEVEILLLVTEEQHLHAPLTPIESARLITLCSQFCAHSETASILIYSKTNTRNEFQRNKIVKLLELEEPIRTNIHTGVISLKTAFALAEMSRSDRLTLYDIFIKLALNSNKQRRIIDLCMIIATSQQYSISEFLSVTYPELQQKTIDNVPQSVNRLLHDLYKCSHPLSSHVEKQFAEKIKKLRLPQSCSLSHSPAFEQDSVTLGIEFKTIDELTRIWPKIKDHL
jgi:ParB/RepB/Spo0J family partition protein